MIENSTKLDYSYSISLDKYSTESGVKAIMEEYNAKNENHGHDPG